MSNDLTVERVAQKVEQLRKLPAGFALEAATRWFESAEARDRGARFAEAAAAQAARDLRGGEQDCGESFPWDAADVDAFQRIIRSETEIASLIRSIPTPSAQAVAS